MMIIPRVILLSAFLAMFSGPAFAQTMASSWAETDHARVRLIASAWDGGGDAHLGLQIELEPGWKTYWRNPGDAGVPPRMRSKSGNVKSLKLLWPVPERFTDTYGVSIGYSHSLVLPLLVKAEKPGKPIKLMLDFEYGVCGDVCLPISAKLELPLSPAANEDSPYQPLIAKWRSRVPGEAGSATGLDLVSVIPEIKGGKTSLLVTISGKDGLKTPGLFAEGPREYYFTVPVLKSSANGKATFLIEIDGAKSMDDLKGKPLIFTMLDKDRAAETVWTAQ